MKQTSTEVERPRVGSDYGLALFQSLVWVACGIFVLNLQGMGDVRFATAGALFGNALGYQVSYLVNRRKWNK